MHRVRVCLLSFCWMGILALATRAQDLPQLVEGLKSADAAGRERAAMALGDLGPAAAAAVPELTARLKDEAPLVRAHAAIALGKVGPAASSAVPSLAAAAKDPDPAVRRAHSGRSPARRRARPSRVGTSPGLARLAGFRPGHPRRTLWPRPAARARPVGRRAPRRAAEAPASPGAGCTSFAADSSSVSHSCPSRCRDRGIGERQCRRIG